MSDSYHSIQEKATKERNKNNNYHHYYYSFLAGTKQIAQA
jgi:hypothetical protein